MYVEGAEIENTAVARHASESDPLLGESEEELASKPFYRARPLWLVPFAITAAVVRGMTLAPRIEVFTQLSCNKLHGHNRYNHTETTSFISITQAIPQESITPFYFTLDPLGPSLHPHHLHPNTSPNVTFVSGMTADDNQEEDPRRLPSARCLSDPAVQAGAARLQTIMTTTMGILSALTTGWWGHFGERHGRTKVLAIVTFGFFLTDLIFILVSTPSSPFSAHGHKLLVLAPMIEGALGGWSTLQSATSAYLSDCTSSGSRANIFSRFSGVFYVGLSLGPSVGGYFIKNPIWKTGGALTVTSVFWIAIICSFINFMLVLFVFPESLDKVKRTRALAEHNVKACGKGKARDHDACAVGQGSGASAEESSEAGEGIIRGFLKPLALFLPVVVFDGGLKKRRDWSLTFLGAALFASTLSNGVHQVKYLYAEHVYGWGAEQLSYYISFLSGARATFLLVLCPWIIATFKPKPQPETHTDPSSSTLTPGKKPKPTKGRLAREISFDLLMTRFSLMIDILSNTFVTLGPMPMIHALGASSLWTQESQPLFVLATAMSSLGSGAGPALQSLALCIVQVRTLDASAAKGDDAATVKEEGVGQLLGALAVVQTLGQMILGPMLFGLVYSGTVAAFPKAVFVTAGGLLICSLMLVMLVRGPVIPNAGGPVSGKGTKKGKRKVLDGERGRSRVSKDLRGGATKYGSVASSSAS
ncbi:major facilitator superfamily domain-containing protein [Lyophyllum atratum]|nr:major facilitator superfamily domain-containing protein [Lyophyllum atratum]